MNIRPSTSVFPSYHAIKQQIQKGYIYKYQKKINQLKSHISKLKAEHDFDKDHEDIQFSIMNLATQNNQQVQYEKGKVKVVDQNERRYRNSGEYGESLNYYIEDDGEQENNYQTYLKFKKKTLERDLEDEMKTKVAGNTQEMKKQKAEEELFFRKLYVNDTQKSPFLGRRCASAKVLSQKKKMAVFDIKESKQNANFFLNKLNKKTFKARKQIESSLRKSKLPKKEQGIEMQKASYEKNKKYLTQNYLDILKKLDNTNVVKWRVLNTDTELEK